MKESTAISALLVPGEETAEWWRPDRRGEWRRQEKAPSASAQCGYTFSAFACHSYPLWINADEDGIMEQIALMELERMGAGQLEPGSSQLAIRVTHDEMPRRQIQAIQIPSALGDPEIGEHRWEYFVPSPCLYPYPRHRIVIWKELGRYVAAFTREGRLVHFHGFGKGGLSEESGREMACLAGELSTRRLIDSVDAVLLWTGENEDPAAAAALQNSLGLPVEMGPRPRPDPGSAPALDLVPETVVSERVRKEETKRRNWTMLLIAAGYMAIVGLGIFDLLRRDNRNQVLYERIQQLQPASESVREARAQWESVGPAVDVERFPVEIFHRVASLLPPKGVRLTQFEIQGNDQIILRGEARSVPVAVQFKAALESSPDLRGYDWDVPQPDSSGATTRFIAYGTYRFGNQSEG